MATKVFKGTLQLGLLNIPVFLNVAARTKRVEMNSFHTECNSQIRQPKYCPNCEKILTPDEVYRGYNAGSDKAPRVVKIEDSELEAITPETGSTIEISCVVKAAEVDVSFLAESFFMLPEEAGRKGYSLLSKVLKDTGRVAIAKICKSHREHVVLIRPKDNGLMAHFLWFIDEIAEVPEFNQLTQAQFTSSEVKLATQLVESLTDEFNPDQYEDGYRLRLNTLIASKMDSTIEAPAPIRATEHAPVVDLISALSASLANPKPKRTIKLETSTVAPAKAAKNGKGKKSKVA